MGGEMDRDEQATCDIDIKVASSTRRSALVIAHPGHELAVHGWMEIARPHVFVLTDGSGAAGVPRLGSTSKVLQAAGATPGSVFGRMPEQAVYRALIGKDTGIFTALAEELAEALIQGGFDEVYGDMEEGFNPVHDTWRMVLDAAVAIVKRKTGHQLENYDFSLFRRQDTFHSAGQQGARVELESEAFMRKLKVARAYPELAPEVLAATEGIVDNPILSDPKIRDQVKKILGSLGLDAFRVEYFRRLPSTKLLQQALDSDRPFYEAYGELLVAAGHYRGVLRRDLHLAPVAEALRCVAEAEGLARTAEES